MPCSIGLKCRSKSTDEGRAIAGVGDLIEPIHQEQHAPFLLEVSWVRLLYLRAEPCAALISLEGVE